MTKIIAAAVAFFFLLQGLAGAAPQKVTVVYMQDAPPVAWAEDGKALGLEPAVAEYCLSKLGLKADHQFYPWLRAQEMIRTGEADLIITTPTVERFAYAAFGKGKAVVQDWSLFTHKDNRALIAKAKRFDRLEDLKPYTIVDYIGNGWTANYLKEGYDIYRVGKSELLPGMLALKRGDFVIENPGLIAWWAKKSKTSESIAEIKTKLPHTKFHYVFIVSRKSPWLAKGLIKGLDEALLEMKKSGEWDKVMNKYDFPLEPKGFKSQIETDQFYLDYEKYPNFERSK